jgi:hypothetical protein
MDRLIRSIDGVLSPARTTVAGAAASPAAGAKRLGIGIAAVVAIALFGAGGYYAFLPARSPSPAPPERQGAGPSLAPASEPAIKNAAAPPRIEPDVKNAAAPARTPSKIPDKTPDAPLRVEPEPPTYRVLANVSGGVQNLRSGPAVRYPLVVAVPAGATGLTLGACRASEDGTKPWCAARWRSYSGFISSCCIVDEKTGAPPRVD